MGRSNRLLEPVTPLGPDAHPRLPQAPHAPLSAPRRRAAKLSKRRTGVNKGPSERHGLACEPHRKLHPPPANRRGFVAIRARVESAGIEAGRRLRGQRCRGAGRRERYKAETVHGRTGRPRPAAGGERHSCRRDLLSFSADARKRCIRRIVSLEWRTGSARSCGQRLPELLRQAGADGGFQECPLPVARLVRFDPTRHGEISPADRIQRPAERAGNQRKHGCGSHRCA